MAFGLDATQERELARVVDEAARVVIDHCENANKRNDAVVRVHETGWKLVAQALERGLRDIADAIRAYR